MDSHPHSPNLSGNSFENHIQNTLISELPTSRNLKKIPSLNPLATSFYLPNNGNVSPRESSDIHLEKETCKSPKSILRALKASNIDRPVIAQLNINYLAPKFEPLESLIEDNIDLLMISETKIDDTFQTEQFKLKGYSKPIRLDRNRNGGGIMIFSRGDLPCHEIETQDLPADVCVLRNEDTAI